MTTNETSTDESVAKNPIVDPPLEFRIDPEIQNLMPPLPESEYEILKNSIIHVGCRVPLLVWKEKRVLLDGHNRYKICTQNAMSYEVKEISFPDDNAAILWVAGNQLARRHLSTWGKVKLVENFRPIFEKQAAERKSAGGGDKKSPMEESGLQKLAEPMTVAGELGKLAGVSHTTIDHARRILDFKDKSPDIIQKLDTGEWSIHHAYKNIQNLFGPFSKKNSRKKHTDEKVDNPDPESPKLPVLRRGETADTSDDNSNDAAAGDKYYTADELCVLKYDLIQKIMNYVLDLILAVDQNDKARSDKYVRDLRNAITKL